MGLKHFVYIAACLCWTRTLKGPDDGLLDFLGFMVILLAVYAAHWLDCNNGDCRETMSTKSKEVGMRCPGKIHAEDMRRWDVFTKKEGSEAWVLARPEPYWSIKARLRLTWHVFTGKADALYWAEQPCRCIKQEEV